MIKNIIFDFGDIFINLDKEATFREMMKFGLTEPTLELLTLAKEYETSAISSKAFLDSLNRIFPKATPQDLTEAWNAILLDFPEYRLRFIEEFHREANYRLFLLSNTNEIHINYVMESMGMKDYKRFKACFEQFYLSHEINLRKPNTEIYEFVLNENELNASETLFIDDTKENIEGARKLGIHGWHLQVGVEDITDLKNRL
jgi:putative hydrolase of the HAD superfamily